jgi:predicted transcriptional regulator YheO
MAVDVATQRLITFQVLQAAITALSSVTGRNTEILLHDLTCPEQSVVAIANGHISGRSVGSPVLSGPEQDKGFTAVMAAAKANSGCDPVVISDYPTVINGHYLRSATAVFRDQNGHPFAALCVNADFTGLAAAQAFLQQFQPSVLAPNDQASAPGDMEKLMDEIIHDSLAKFGVKKMNKTARIEAVRVMQERGIFIVKGGVERAASALGVTRFTIYNYLEHLRVDLSANR